MAAIIVEIPIRSHEVVVDGERQTLNKIVSEFWVVREDGIPGAQYITSLFKERFVPTGQDTEVFVKLVNVPYSQDGQGENGPDVTHDQFQTF